MGPRPGLAFAASGVVLVIAGFLQFPSALFGKSLVLALWGLIPPIWLFLEYRKHEWHHRVWLVSTDTRIYLEAKAAMDRVRAEHHFMFRIWAVVGILLIVLYFGEYAKSPEFPVRVQLLADPLNGSIR